MKLCKRCSIEKELTEFFVNKATKDGYQNLCKKCNIEANRIYLNPKREWNKPSVKRYCIGVKCRGQKMFLSIGGARICQACKKLISELEPTYTDSVIIPRRSR
jgi:hypothetical protein